MIIGSVWLSWCGCCCFVWFGVWFYDGSVLLDVIGVLVEVSGDDCFGCGVVGSVVKIGFFFCRCDVYVCGYFVNFFGVVLCVCVYSFSEFVFE